MGRERAVIGTACDVSTTYGKDFVIERASDNQAGREITFWIHRYDMEQAGGAGVVHEVDVRDAAQVEAFAQRAVDEWGRLDIAVANAGVLRRAPLVELTDAAWDDMLQVDLTGVLRTLRSAAARIRGARRRRGRQARMGATGGPVRRHGLRPELPSRR
jgi:NAD(P)-dependent dehydrogenase (short-subunit alcohol dehydrogenase family)